MITILLRIHIVLKLYCQATNLLCFYRFISYVCFSKTLRGNNVINWKVYGIWSHYLENCVWLLDLPLLLCYLEQKVLIFSKPQKSMKILTPKDCFEELIKWSGNWCSINVMVIFVNSVIPGWFTLILCWDRKDEHLFLFIFKESKEFLLNATR